MRERGDAALVALTERFDRVALAPAGLAVTDAEFDKATRDVGEATLAALRYAAARVEAFHRATLPRAWSMTDACGSRLGQEVRPLERVGIYVPGGRAAYPSTVLMTAVPARVAGVREIVLVSPPSPDGSLNPAVLAAARIAGVTEAYRVGGAQAVAALAYGTETIRRVDKIVGPGNIYVALAKSRVFGDVGIDMLAGPSEVVIIADEGADPAFVAADLLAQAEHDPMARSVLLTPSAALLAAVERRRRASSSRCPAGKSQRARWMPTARSCSRGASPRRWTWRTGSRRSTWSSPWPSPRRSSRGCAARAPCSSGTTRRRWWATTWRARTTCCRRAAPRASPPRSRRKTS